MLKLPSVTALDIDKGAVLALAAQALPSMYTANHDPAYRARLIAVKSFRQHATNALAKMIQARITELYQEHEIISEPRDEVDESYRDAWDEGLSFALEQDLSEIRSMIGSAAFEEIAGSEVGYHEVGRIEEISVEMAQCVAPHYVNVQDKDTGKFLSKVGIGTRALKDVIKLAETTPAPDKPGPDDPEVEVIEAGAGTDAVSGGVSGTAVRAGPPSKEELGVAFKAWAQATGPDFNHFAELLGVSGATVRNYAAGKTLPRLDSTQTKVLADDCEACIGKLNGALGVFRRMSPANGAA